MEHQSLLKAKFKKLLSMLDWIRQWEFFLKQMCRKGHRTKEIPLKRKINQYEVIL